MLWQIKYLLSFSKSSWEIEDYPIFVHQNQSAPLGRWEAVAWTVSVDRWPTMIGFGDTQQEALDDLRRNFSKYKASRERLPRPGTKVPLQFAASDVIDRYAAIARDFLKQIFDVDYDRCFISDRSSMWDFYWAGDDDALFQRIQNIYNVDVSRIPDGNLVRICAMIAVQKAVRLRDSHQTGVIDA
jgi:hypothetical protein